MNSNIIIDWFFPLEKSKLDKGYPAYTVPKARPRVGSRRTHFPVSYTDWRTAAELAILQNIEPLIDEPLRKMLSSPLIFCCQFSGKAIRKNADVDNLVGSWLDAFVATKVLPGDSVNQVRCLYGEYRSEQKQSGTRVVIAIAHNRDIIDILLAEKNK